MLFLMDSISNLEELTIYFLGDILINISAVKGLEDIVKKAKADFVLVDKLKISSHELGGEHNY